MKKFLLFVLCLGLMFGCRKVEKVEKYQPPEAGAVKFDGDTFKLGKLMSEPKMDYAGGNENKVINFLVLNENFEIIPVINCGNWKNAVVSYYYARDNELNIHKSESRIFWLPGLKIGETVFLKIIKTSEDNDADYIYGTEAEVMKFTPPAPVIKK
jgi:hypothetical protein